MSRFTKIKKDGIVVPVGTNSDNITLRDGSILEEALGNINVAEKGSIMTQINNLPTSLKNSFASIDNAIFRKSFHFQNDENSESTIMITPNDNNRVTVSIAGDLIMKKNGTVPATSQLGTIVNSQWSGNLPITGIFRSTGDNTVATGVTVQDSGIGFSLQDLSTITLEELQNKNAEIRNSTYSIYPGYVGNNNTPKLLYNSNGVHSFNITSNGSAKEIVNITSSGLKVNGEISCTSFSNPNMMKKINIGNYTELKKIMLDYDNYPGWTPYLVWLKGDLTKILTQRSSGFSSPGFMWKAGDPDKNSYRVYLFYFGTGGGHYTTTYSFTHKNGKTTNCSLNTRAIVGNLLFTNLDNVAESKIK